MRPYKRRPQGEDALARLMERHAREDGARLWREYEASCAARKKTVTETPVKRSRSIGKNTLSAISRLAACAVLLLVFVTATFLKADADSHIYVDRYLKNSCSLSELKNRYIIHVRLFPGSEVQDTQAIADVMDSVIQKGYQLKQSYCNHNATKDRPAVGLFRSYENDQGQQIRLESRVPLSGVIIVYKSGGAHAVQVEHLGYNMVLVEKGNSRQIFWLDDAEGLCYSLYTEGLMESEFWDLVYGLAQE